MGQLDHADYIVVGAGSAGSVVAARLSESGKDRVLLLEAGPEDRNFWLHAPLGIGFVIDDPRYNWLYESEPEPHLNNARIFQPRGKVLGGTSSINGMNFLRGHPGDFDRWGALGNEGWSYADVLPYFRRLEDNARGADEFRGVGGPQHISDIPRHELAEAFIEAGVQAGYSRNDDFNGATQDGFGYQQLTVHKGRRWSTAAAYLRPAAGRANLEIRTGTPVSRILFQAGRATGVEIRQGGERKILPARKAVIVCAGTIASPQLLQISGIGPAALLSSQGCPVVVDRPGVGENLRDHFTVPMTYRCKKPVTLNDVMNSPFRRYAMGLRYLLTHTGFMATNATFCAGYIRSSEDEAKPDLKLNLSFWGRSTSARARDALGLLPFSSFTPSVAHLHPDSRGSVRIKTPDTSVHPEIRFNFFATERDRGKIVTGLRLLRRLLTMPAMAAYTGEEHTPGPACASDEELTRYCAQRGRSYLHAVGTCKMGKDDMSVVDARLRVHGVDGLRVVDASIMPELVGANTNAAAIMIGEKGADMILEDNR